MHPSLRAESSAESLTVPPVLCSALPAPVLAFSSKSSPKPQEIPAPPLSQAALELGTPQNLFTAQALLSVFKQLQVNPKESPLFFLTLQTGKTFRSPLVSVSQTKTL